MYPASSEGLNKETDEAVYFFTPAFDALNNFSAHRIEIWDEVFPTGEHAYHWKKFETKHPDVADKILNAKSVEMSQRIAHQHNDYLPDDWHETKVGSMEEILRAKLEQHEDVKELLLKTGGRQIIENSPIDSFWGVGEDGTGENQVGKMWMKLREEFKN